MGTREVLGFEVADSEDGAFWTAFVRSLKARGLAGVQLVSSDPHAELKAARLQSAQSNDPPTARRAPSW
jgi:putative transposase